MRIIHVATLVTPNGDYGGPVRVAVNLTKALEKQGTTAELWVGSTGYDSRRRRIDGANVRLFPARVMVPSMGFCTTMAWGILRSVFLDRKNIDVLHIHLARDMVTMPVAILALLFKIPYVVQSHGMIIVKNRVMARVFDFFITRPVLRGAGRILCLTEFEESMIRELEPRVAQYTRMENAVQLPSTLSKPYDQARCEVLFLARITSRKRPLWFIQAAVELLSRGRDVNFRLVGPDGGEAREVKNAIVLSRSLDMIKYEGPLSPEKTLERLNRCDFYVLPSFDDFFPMSVIEAMSLGKPVIITDSCGLAEPVRSFGAGFVIESDQKMLIETMDKLILNQQLRREMGARARSLVEAKFNIDNVAATLVVIYEQAVSAGVVVSEDSSPQGGLR